MFIFCYFLLLFVYSIKTLPTDSSRLSQKETRGKFYQGDIILTDDQRRILGVKGHENWTHETDKPHAALTNDLSLKWNLPILYIFHKSFYGKKSVVRSAFKYWEELTCLKFEETNREPANDTGPFLRIVTDNGYCYSYIGAVEQGQFISLGYGCVYLAIAAHEIGHALGLWHEQSRPDRDDHVEIVEQNIDPADLDQFEKMNQSTIRSSLTPYDYGSVMHYGAYDFALDQFKPTILTKNPHYMKSIGQRDELSFFDAKAINYMYCNDVCNVSLPCQKEGYTDPKDCSKCRCPEGYGGKLCEEIIDTKYSACGSQNLNATNEWQSLNISGFVDCNFGLQAQNSKIQIIIKANRSSFLCDDVCTTSGGYLEVRYEDQLTIGPRFCCIPALGISLITHHNRALIMYRGRRTSSVLIQYRNWNYLDDRKEQDTTQNV